MKQNDTSTRKNASKIKCSVCLYFTKYHWVCKRIIIYQLQYPKDKLSAEILSICIIKFSMILHLRTFPYIGNGSEDESN